MNYYHFKPEVPGQMGKGTAYNKQSSAWDVIALNVVFDGWLGGNIMTVSPCYFVSKELQEALLFNFSGIKSYQYLLIEKSNIFEELQPNVILPEFSWVTIDNKPFEEDFAVTKYDGLYNQLIISEKARDVIFEFPLGVYRIELAFQSKLEED